MQRTKREQRRIQVRLQAYRFDLNGGRTESSGIKCAPSPVRVVLPSIVHWPCRRSCSNSAGPMRFCCVECGQEANADLVAAINVGRAGLARIACEVNDAVSRQQQEPTSVAA